MQDIAPSNSEDGFDCPNEYVQSLAHASYASPNLQKKKSGSQFAEGAEFEAIKRLGKGAQASVYLAKATNLTEDIQE